MQAFATPIVLGVRSTLATNTVLRCYRRSLPHASLGGTRRYRGGPNARDDERRHRPKSYDDRVEYGNNDDKWGRQARGKRRSLLDTGGEDWMERSNDRGRRGGRREARQGERGTRAFEDRRESRFKEYDGGARKLIDRRNSRSGYEDNRERNFDRPRGKRFYGDRQDDSYAEVRQERDFDRFEEANRFERHLRSRETERRRERVEEPSEVQKALASGDDLVYGLQSVKQALAAGRRTLHTLYLQSTPGGSGGERKADNQRIRKEIERVAHAASLRIVLLDRGELNALSSNRPHQGVVLRCDALEYGTDAATLDEPQVGDVLLALDEVQDPQNVGALLRSAAFLGARGVVVCARNSAPLTPVVSRASAGAAESVVVAATDSMPRFLRRAHDMGWRVLGAASGKDAVDIGSVEKGPPTVLVLGSEGNGLRTMVRNCCDECIEISRAEDAPEALDSLNVSVAGALALFKLLR